ncbi:MAG: hypothetical protein AAFX06_26895 [Planctomycetota bacterium]
MARYGLAALLIFTTVFAAVFAIVEEMPSFARPMFTFLVLAVASLPVPTVILASASETNGNQLDFRGNTAFVACGTVWLTSVALLACALAAVWVKDLVQ